MAEYRLSATAEMQIVDILEASEEKFGEIHKRAICGSSGEGDAGCGR
jgi:hypothetical protein